MTVAEVRQMQDEITQVQIKKAQFEADFRKKTEAYEAEANQIISRFSKLKAKLDARSDILRMEHQKLKQYGDMAELSLDLGALREYLFGQTLPSSTLINQVCTWSQAEEVSKIRQMHSAMNIQLTQLN